MLTGMQFPGQALRSAAIVYGNTAVFIGFCIGSINLTSFAGGWIGGLLGCNAIFVLMALREPGGREKAGQARRWLGALMVGGLVFSAWAAGCGLMALPEMVAWLGLSDLEERTLLSQMLARVAYWNGLLMTLLALFTARPTRVMMRRCLWAILLTGVVLAFLGGWSTLSRSVLVPWWPDLASRGFAAFAYKNHWGYFSLLVAAAGTALAWDAWQRERHSGHLPEKTCSILFLILLCLATIPLARARGAFLLALLLVAWVGIRLWRKRTGPVSLRTRLGLVGVLLCMAGFTMMLAWPQWENLSTKTRHQWQHVERGSFEKTLRLALYRDSWQLIQQRPLTGWGPDSFGLLYPEVAGDEYHASRVPRSDFEHVHSDYWEMVLETGAVGLLILAAWVGFVIAYWRRYPGKQNSLSIWLRTGAWLIALAATFDRVMESPAVTMGAVLFLGLALAHAHACSQSQSPATTQAR